jgi:hypothetical protein
MMLIIEGTDLTGKTTLAKELVKRLCSQNEWHLYQHLTRPPAGWDYYEDYIKLMHPRSVWDRFHMGNLVYQEIDGTGTQHTPISYGMLDAHVRLQCGMVIVCIAAEDVIEAAWKRKPHGDEMFRLDILLKVNERYKQLCHGEVHGWSPMIDFMHYNPDVNWPGGDDAFMDRVVAIYLHRLREWKCLQGS